MGVTTRARNLRPKRYLLNVTKGTCDHKSGMKTKVPATRQARNQVFTSHIVTTSDKQSTAQCRPQASTSRGKGHKPPTQEPQQTLHKDDPEPIHQNQKGTTNRSTRGYSFLEATELITSFISSYLLTRLYIYIFK